MATKTITLSTYSKVIVTYTTSSTSDSYTLTITQLQFTNSRGTGTTQKLNADFFGYDNMSSAVYANVLDYTIGNTKLFTIAKGTKSKTVALSGYRVTWRRAAAAQSAPIVFYVSMDNGGSGFWEGSGTVTITVPALPTYAVGYNANGGTGAPAAQTKTHGQALTLRSTRPTRTNHKFLGWATSAGATAATYQPGGSYGANAAATLYAVWRQVYASPALVITRSYRCDANGDPADEGTYAAVELSWTTWAANSVTALTATVNGVTVARSAMTETVAADGRSGTAKAVVNAGMADNLSYAVSASVTDSGCTEAGVSGTTATATRSDSISEAYFPMDFLAGGHGAGIGTPATEDGALRIAHRIRQLDSGGNTVMLADRSGNLSITGSLTQGSDRRLKLHVRELSGDEDTAAFVRSLRPALYRKGGGLRTGFYAQDVAESDPWGTETVAAGEDGYLALDYTALIAPIVAYAQALEARVAELEQALGKGPGPDRAGIRQDWR